MGLTRKALKITIPLGLASIVFVRIAIGLVVSKKTWRSKRFVRQAGLGFMCKCKSLRLK